MHGLDSEDAVAEHDDAADLRGVASREVSKEEVLAAAKPLPPIEKMLIEGLTDQEGQRFLNTIRTM